MLPEQLYLIRGIAGFGFRIGDPHAERPPFYPADFEYRHRVLAQVEYKISVSGVDGYRLQPVVFQRHEYDVSDIFSCCRHNHIYFICEYNEKYWNKKFYIRILMLTGAS